MAVHPLYSQEAFQEAGNAELKVILKGTLVAGQPGMSSHCLNKEAEAGSGNITRLRGWAFTCVCVQEVTWLLELAS